MRKHYFWKLILILGAAALWFFAFSGLVFCEQVFEVKNTTGQKVIISYLMKGCTSFKTQEILPDETKQLVNFEIFLGKVEHLQEETLNNFFEKILLEVGTYTIIQRDVKKTNHWSWRPGKGKLNYYTLEVKEEHLKTNPNEEHKVMRPL